MSELVLLHHNEPMTTSLALAAGTKNEHNSVILLVRKFIDDLEEFGKVGFETAPEGFHRFQIDETVMEVENKRGKQGGRTEFAFLNEPQATLMITYMRNSEVVRRFKIALVKAFYELRAAVSPAPTFRAVDHRADVLVSADRTFRAILRSCRAAGARLPAALARANEVTVRETGIDMLAQIGPVERPVADLSDPVAEGVAVWAEKAGAGPWSMEDVLAQAFGVDPTAREWTRLAVVAGSALREAGFVRRKTRLRGFGLRNYWERSV